MLYGPHNRVFAYGIGMAGDQSSMVALLETTKAVVSGSCLERMSVRG